MGPGIWGIPHGTVWLCKVRALLALFGKGSTRGADAECAAESQHILNCKGPSYEWMAHIEIRPQPWCSAALFSSQSYFKLSRGSAVLSSQWQSLPCNTSHSLMVCLNPKSKNYLICHIESSLTFQMECLAQGWVSKRKDRAAQGTKLMQKWNLTPPMHRGSAALLL